LLIEIVEKLQRFQVLILLVLVSELWLEPAREAYGADYSSGRIRIAMSRGNKVLKDSSGVDGGCNRLESGVLMGQRDDVRQRSIIREDYEGWHSQFHNYTLIWKPGFYLFSFCAKFSRFEFHLNTVHSETILDFQRYHIAVFDS
jgi:hypothetical protein